MLREQLLGSPRKGKQQQHQCFQAGKAAQAPAGALWSAGHLWGEEDCFFKEAFLDYFKLPKRNCILDIISWFCGRTWE